MRAFLLALALIVPSLTAAQSAEDFERALLLRELSAILAEEAQNTAEEIDRDMLGGQGGSVFATQVEQINAPARLSSQVAEALANRFNDADASALLSFLESEQAQRAIALEISARRAFLGEGVEEFARSQAGKSPHASQIARLLESGNMVEENRETAEATTAAFYYGLRAGGAVELSDAEIAALAAEQSEALNADTEAWLKGFFSLAYSPLSQQDMDVLVAFWETELGMRFSTALYDAFDAAYIERWFAMGQSAALFLSAEDI